MKTVNIHAAKTHLSRLVEEAAAGEEILLAGAGRPVARLGPLAAQEVRRRPGLMRGRIRIARDFDAPLPAEVLASFFGSALGKPRRS
jgi:prevent-host-death family protein